MSGGSSSPRRAALGVSLAIVGVLALGAAQALATGSLIIANDSTTDYVTQDPDLVTQGDTAQFMNNGGVTHTVTADAPGPDGKPLFDSGNNPGGGAIRDVAGTNFLSTDDYPFHCSIHPAMQGTLHVGVLGAPDERPEISVKIKSKKLEKVVKSGKLKVKVTAGEPTDADGVSLSAKKGSKGITKKAKLNLAAGQSETSKLKLKKNAAEKLADLDKAKVKVTGEVDFGSPDKASKKLK